jgi:hypothetical protein
MASHWYFYGFDDDFGPFHIKFCGYFPYTGQIYYGRHEYAKRQCLSAGSSAPPGPSAPRSSRTAPAPTSTCSTRKPRPGST